MNLPEHSWFKRLRPAHFPASDSFCTACIFQNIILDMINICNFYFLSKNKKKKPNNCLLKSDKESNFKSLKIWVFDDSFSWILKFLVLWMVFILIYIAIYFMCMCVLFGCLSVLQVYAVHMETRKRPPPTHFIKPLNAFIKAIALHY